jgi:RNA polymerase sigma-70 factor, ECF subfamily
MLRPDAVPVPATPGLDGYDDAALVEACLRGERAAFDVLVVRHQKAVYQVCYRFVGNHADASDVSQETFLRAWRALSSFKARSSVGTWLYRIAVNASLNRVASRKPTEPVEESALLDQSASASDRVVRDEEAAAVRRAVATLPDRQRATVILRVYHDLSHQEIASILGSSVGSVKANFFHALRNLRRLIADGDR